MCVYVCVCYGGTSSDMSTIKEAVFCNFGLTYLPCCVHPPDIPFGGRGSLEGRVQKYPTSLFTEIGNISNKVFESIKSHIS